MRNVSWGMPAAADRSKSVAFSCEHGVIERTTGPLEGISHLFTHVEKSGGEEELACVAMPVTPS